MPHSPIIQDSDRALEDRVMRFLEAKHVPRFAVFGSESSSGRRDAYRPRVYVLRKTIV